VTTAAAPQERSGRAGHGALDIVVVTGLSGAGRSTAAKCFEDLGYFVVDNLPPELLATMVDLGSRSQGAVTRIAAVMDVRSRAFSSDLRGVIDDLDTAGLAPRVLFLEASDGELVRRFESVRREPAAGRRSAHRRTPPNAACWNRYETPPIWSSTRPDARCTSCAE
jgi:UPF0042 nucleotide-binding protein